MKKALMPIVSILAVAALAASSPVWAAQTASYDEMKQIKKAQREKRLAEKNSATPKPETKWSRFWKNEGERSGLGKSGSGAGHLLRSLNPAPFFKSQEEQYNARKNSGSK